MEAYIEDAFFAVNVLAEDQVEISENFASRAENKFDRIHFEVGENGSPIIPGCLAILECTLVDTYDGGDHLILVGQVNCLHTTDNGAPLLRYRGQYASMGIQHVS